MSTCRGNPSARFRSAPLTLMGRTQDVSADPKAFGVIDRATDIADVAFIGAAIAIGALVYKVVACR